MQATEKQTHTPGPWRIGEAPTGEPHPWIEGERDMERAIFGADSVKIAICEQWHPNLEAESDANARLIAAAPELLAFAERMAIYFAANLGGYDDMREQAAAAIAKARGDA